jgi:hypothetical protein
LEHALPFCSAQRWGYVWDGTTNTQGHLPFLYTIYSFCNNVHPILIAALYLAQHSRIGIPTLPASGIFPGQESQTKCGADRTVGQSGQASNQLTVNVLSPLSVTEL